MFVFSLMHVCFCCIWFSLFCVEFQCFDTVGWITGRALDLHKTYAHFTSKVLFQNSWCKKQVAGVVNRVLPRRCLLTGRLWWQRLINVEILWCDCIARWLPSVLWCCWLGGRKGIRPVKNWVLTWLSVWSEVQICIWPSWCHCHSLPLASVKSR